MAFERSDETIFTTVARLRQRSERLRALAPEEPPAEAPIELAEPEPAVYAEATEPEPEVELWIPADPGLPEAPLFAPSDDDFEPIDFERIPADVAEQVGPGFDSSLFEVADLDLPDDDPLPVDASKPLERAILTPESELEPAEPARAAEEPAEFPDAADIIRNDLAQPSAREQPATEASDELDPDFDAVQERAMAGLVDPGERERLVEKYAPVVDLQRLPKSRPQRVLDKAKKLAADASKPTPAPKPSAPAFQPGVAAKSIGEPQPEQGAKSASPDSGDKPKAKKKRVSLLDSYFKGL